SHRQRQSRTSAPRRGRWLLESQSSAASNSYRLEGASTRKADLAPLRQRGGIRQGFADILFFEVWKIRKQFRDGGPSGKGFEDHSHRDAHSTNARLAAHDVRIHGDAAEFFHKAIITWGPAAIDDKIRSSVPLVHLQRMRFRRHLNSSGSPITNTQLTR